MNIDVELDNIFEVVEELMVEGEFTKIGTILDNVNVQDTPTEVLLGYLTSVCILRDEPNINYNRLRARVVGCLQTRHPHKWEAMLHGL